MEKRCKSQSAFVRGFIDDSGIFRQTSATADGLNPRSCAASSMTLRNPAIESDDVFVSIRVRARLHR